MEKYVFQFLVGALEHFLFSIIYGIILPTDFRIFQDGVNHQPENQSWKIVSFSVISFFCQSFHVIP